MMANYGKRRTDEKPASVAMHKDASNKKFSQHKRREVTAHTFLERAHGYESTKPHGKKEWSHTNPNGSKLLDHELGIFQVNDPVKIADSLKRSAEANVSHTESARRAAAAMLDNQLDKAKAGSQERIKLEQAKQRLDELFER